LTFIFDLQLQLPARETTHPTFDGRLNTKMSDSDEAVQEINRVLGDMDDIDIDAMISSGL
jgi:hypothetical protein